MSRSHKARRPETTTPHRREAPRARRAHSLLKTAAVLVAATLLGGLVAGGVLFGILHWGDSTTGPKSAAIVDQLSLTQPNPAFAQEATSTLERAGYAVDYYPGGTVTVEFYKNLPARGYDLIIMRVHSGLSRDYGKPTGDVSLFSGEPFDETKYAEEKAAGLLGRASYYDGSPQVFGITPDFIESSMRGRFDGATVALMGCDSLTTDSIAEAFVRKGAKAVVGWNGRVSASYTDAATQRLLQHLLVEEHPTREAVVRTMAEVGPDPDYGSTLLYYP